jgi:DNA uptake protein ComE-like DNA-binding protein
MVVRAARHADDPGLIRINARSSCAHGQPSRASQCGITRRTYRNVHPSRSAPAKPATTGAATAPQVAKTNLNTATAAELDKLPQIGPARSKAIIEARAKAKFKNWDDFVARKLVPADAAAAIKDVVSF